MGIGRAHAKRQKGEDAGDWDEAGAGRVRGQDKTGLFVLMRGGLDAEGK